MKRPEDYKVNYWCNRWGCEASIDVTDDVYHSIVKEDANCWMRGEGRNKLMAARDMRENLHQLDTLVTNLLIRLDQEIDNLKNNPSSTP